MSKFGGSASSKRFTVAGDYRIIMLLRQAVVRRTDDITSLDFSGQHEDITEWRSALYERHRRFAGRIGPLVLPPHPIRHRTALPVRLALHGHMEKSAIEGIDRQNGE
jgi:hypothetical protein